MRTKILSIAGFAVVAITTIAIAVETSGPPIEPPVYRPVTSDLMIAVIQPRHVKLWLAGKAQNWDYAEYERHNIGGALARIAKTIPTYKGQSTNALVAAFATRQLDALSAAIKAKDPAAFDTAYEGLTTGCNECHEATGHAMIVLQTPATGPFPDQVFQATGR